MGEKTVAKKIVYYSLNLLLAGLTFYGCSRKPSLREWVATAPEQVIAKQDSILQVIARDPEKQILLLEAFQAVAEKQWAAGDDVAAEKTLEQGLALQPDNVDMKYSLAMLCGKRLFKKGSSGQLWDAIEQFNKASYYKPDDAVALYWIARGYEKNDEDDFENIIEYYTAALEKGLPEELREKAQKALDRARKDQELLKSFWQ